MLHYSTCPSHSRVMPLLHKAPYQFRSVPQDLKDEDEVFHIRATKEVFKTYEYPFDKTGLQVADFNDQITD